MKALTFAVIFTMFLIINAQQAEGQTSTSTGVPFLLIAPNSRFGGMGETGTAIADDASAMFWNPSGLAFQKSGAEINVTHSPWLAGLGLGDLFYDYVAGKKYIKEIGGTVGASLTYLNIGEVAVSDEFGNSQKERNYNSYEMSIALGYATKLGNNWAGGISSRFIYSRLSPNDNYVAGEKGTGTGISASFDLSAMYRPVEGPEFFKNRFSAGFNLSNIGPNISYVDADQADPLPAQLRIGFSYSLIKSEFNNLTLALDFSKLLINRAVNKTESNDGTGKKNSASGVDPFYKAMFTSWQGGINGIAKSIQTSVGAEYWYGSPKLIALRAGYFYEDPVNGNRKYYTLGAGLRFSHYGFDMSYISTIEEYHPLANTLRFGLSINFK